MSLQSAKTILGMQARYQRNNVVPVSEDPRGSSSRENGSKASGKPRVPSLQVHADGDRPTFEIIAVPGLGADPHFTWTKEVQTSPQKSDEHDDATAVKAKNKVPTPRVHLLDLFVEFFPMARILRFEDNSDWQGDAVVKTTDEMGRRLWAQIEATRLPSRLPIILIGHSLGGLVIKQALCAGRSESAIDDILGIIFLGTPHQGASAAKGIARLATALNRFRTDDTLLKFLTKNNPGLSDLRDRFDEVLSQIGERKATIRIIAFYETKKSYGLKEPLVNRDSATTHADAYERHLVNTDHSGLNKCCSKNDGLFVQLTDAIERLRYPSRLKLADLLIKRNHYTAARLEIVRLSGAKLDFRQCYINLTIEQRSGQESTCERQETPSSPFSVSAREVKNRPLPGMLSVKDVFDHVQGRRAPFSLLVREKVKSEDLGLSTIFDQRRGPDGALILPRRIMIRGRAGVGKSTLCKKIIHDFLHHGMWGDLFHRILWVPLRNLARDERMTNPGYNFKSLFKDEFFPDNDEFAEELARDWSTKSGDSLFVLDGLDEVSKILAKESRMKDFIEELLRQPNLIVTSRPYANHSAVANVHLEAEVMGFHPDQVVAYLKADPEMTGRVDEFMSFIDRRWILRDLVQVPILLDALCFIWDNPRRKGIHDTMAGIYIAICQTLWEKDLQKLQLDDPESLPSENQSKFQHVQTILELLAFSGLSRNLADFTTDHRDVLARHFRSPKGFPLDATLRCISFMRSSDSPELSNRNYHFLHLTFQEFFAAQYFVRRWIDSVELEYVFNEGESDAENCPAQPFKFLQIYKYSPDYDVFWRLVTGLMAARSADHLRLFFAAVEQEPLDLLGPAHQRLVMHCLAEVDEKSELLIRPKLEARLYQWMMFERDIEDGAGATILAEPGFPEAYLCKALDYHSLRRTMHLQRLDSRILWILFVLKRNKRPLSEKVEARIFELLIEEKFRDEAAITLKCLPSLSMITLRGIMKLLMDKLKDQGLRNAAADVLRGHASLPEEIVNDLIALRRNEDEHLWALAAFASGDYVFDLTKESACLVSLLLGDYVGEGQDWAIRGLYLTMTPSEKTESTLVRLMKEHQSSEARESSAILLGKIPRLFPATLAVLVQVLSDCHDARTTCLVISLLHQQRQKFPESSQEALASLFLRMPDLRFDIAYILREQHSLPTEVSMTLMCVLENEENDAGYRHLAIEALNGSIDCLPHPVVIVLTNLVANDSHSDVLRSSAAALLRYQSTSPADTETLERLLRDKSSCVRSFALKTLSYRDPGLLTTSSLCGVLERQLPHFEVDGWTTESAQAVEAFEALEALQGRSDLLPSDEMVLLRFMSIARALAHEPRPKEEHLGPRIWLEPFVSPLVMAVVAATILARQPQLSEATKESLLRSLSTADNKRVFRFLSAALFGHQKQTMLPPMTDDLVRSAILTPGFLDRILKSFGWRLTSEPQSKSAPNTSIYVDLIFALHSGLVLRSCFERVTLCIDGNLCIIDQSQGRRSLYFSDGEIDRLRHGIGVFNKHYGIFSDSDE